MSSNCELLSHQAGILHGGWLHGGPHKPQNYKNWGVGPCSWMGACSAQYGTGKTKPCAALVQNFMFQSAHIYRKVFLPNFYLLQELGYLVEAENEDPFCAFTLLVCTH